MTKAAESRRYLIRKGAYWYRPECRGYTPSAHEAGLFTEAEAQHFSHPNGADGPRDGMSYHLATDFGVSLPNPDEPDAGEEWLGEMALKTIQRRQQRRDLRLLRAGTLILGVAMLIIIWSAGAFAASSFDTDDWGVGIRMVTGVMACWGLVSLATAYAKTKREIILGQLSL